MFVRWSARADSLTLFKNWFTIIIGALDNLSQNGDEKARDFMARIERFDFILPLVVAEEILQHTAGLSVYLQKKDTDLLRATQQAKIVVDTIKDLRAKEENWDRIYGKATQWRQIYQLCQMFLGKH